jgi:hypothetical protein
MQSAQTHAVVRRCVPTEPCARDYHVLSSVVLPEPLGPIWKQQFERLEDSHRIVVRQLLGVFKKA